MRSKFFLCSSNGQLTFRSVCFSSHCSVQRRTVWTNKGRLTSRCVGDVGVAASGPDDLVLVRLGRRPRVPGQSAALPGTVAPVGNFKRVAASRGSVGVGGVGRPGAGQGAGPASGAGARDAVPRGAAAVRAVATQIHDLDVHRGVGERCGGPLSGPLGLVPADPLAVAGGGRRCEAAGRAPAHVRRRLARLFLELVEHRGGVSSGDDLTGLRSRLSLCEHPEGKSTDSVTCRTSMHSEDLFHETSCSDFTCRTTQPNNCPEVAVASAWVLKELSYSRSSCSTCDPVLGEPHLRTNCKYEYEQFVTT